MDKQEQEAIERAKEVLGEFFGNFAFCVVTEDGSLFYDYRDRYVGKALFVAATEDMENGVGEDWLDWLEEEDTDDDGWDTVGA